MDFYFPHVSGIFQDDNGLIHRACVVKNCFPDHERSFSPTEWPPQSPDLNSIEHFWDQLQRQLRVPTPVPSSLEELSQHLLVVWTNIPLNYLQNLVESISYRMKAVKNVNGCPINY